jgi:predicted transcriptional regulator
MTQRSLATSSGCTQSNLAKIERGKVVPSYALAGRIFQVLAAAERRGEKTVDEVMSTTVTKFETSDLVAVAVSAAKERDIDQFPILRRGRTVGSVTTVQLMGVGPNIRLGEVMGAALPTVPRGTPVVGIRQLLQSVPAVLVVEGDEILGIVSAQDLL